MHAVSPRDAGDGLAAGQDILDGLGPGFWRELVAPTFDVRSRMISRSNSAMLPSICISMRPATVVVSIASVRLRNAAPTAT